MRKVILECENTGFLIYMYTYISFLSGLHGNSRATLFFGKLFQGPTHLAHIRIQAAAAARW